jgi:hypothetical protein
MPRKEDETMKSLRFLLFPVLISLPAAVLAQSGAPKNDAPVSEAQRSFDALKRLTGEWEGRVSVVPEMKEMSGDAALFHVALRVTSRGHAIVHELQQAGTPLDFTKYDHPVTMLYLDGDRLDLVHYCDAGNRPHMEAKASPDGKRVEFELVDVSGPRQHGYMQHAVFTSVDANHHTEDWTFMLPGDKPVQAHFDLRRVGQTASASW